MNQGQPYVPLQRVLDYVSLGGSVQNLEKNIRSIPRVVLDHDGLIPCSIPKELETTVHNLIDWSKGCRNLTPNETAMFTLAEVALHKALRGQCEMHQSLQRRKELEEAEELLVKVCETFDELDPGEAYECIDDLNIEGLLPWWAKRKPKSEREKKLEKINAELSEGMITDMAERILKALETE